MDSGSLHRERQDLGSSGPCCAVARESLQLGDLLTFQNTYKPGLSHAGIYVGNGKLISAVDEARGVIVTALDNVYWRERFVGARRILD